MFMKRCGRSWILALVFLAAAASAKPYPPADDGAVLERLPEKTNPSLRDVKRLRTALDRNPTDLGLAARLARRAIEAARETGDPRFIGQAQAALSPWWSLADPPSQALLLRATIKQSTHDFPGAIVDLDRLLATEPANGQALLTRATVLTVQGRYAEARADCKQVARLAIPLVGIACDAAPASLSGEAASAYSDLKNALAAARGTPDLVEWGETLAAEIAARRGEPDAAEAHFRAALALDPRDPYLLAAYSDFLLDRGRAAEVVPLVKDYVRNDSLLLRLALAEAQVPDAREAFVAHRAELEDRFAAARQRGDSLHRREEARFTLEIRRDPVAALKLARENWAVQRESADLRIFAEAAKAAGDARALDEVRHWTRSHRLEDARLAAWIEMP
jgi:tetratricopeptide (TPR) repeat protein